MYNVFGFRGPFVFAIIVTMVDFVGRLLIIERKDALSWGIDPSAIEVKSSEDTDIYVRFKLIPCNRNLMPHRNTMETRQRPPRLQVKLTQASRNKHHNLLQFSQPAPERLPMLKVIAMLLKFPRAIAAISVTLIKG